MSYIIENFFTGEPRLVRSWDLPDPNPVPQLTICPRTARASYALRQVRAEARWRARTAWRALAHGEPA